VADTIVSKLLMPVRTGDTALTAIAATAGDIERGRYVSSDVATAWRQGRQYVVETEAETVFYRSAMSAAREFCGLSWRMA
jgi:hypothetical protein